MAATSACRQSGSGNAAQGATAAATTAARRPGRIGIQLYAVRGEMQRDMPGTLARLAEIGYREVEFAGYFNRQPADVRALLEANRLTAPSTHVGYDMLQKDWERTLDHAAAVGHEWVTIPWLPESVRGSVDSWKRVAAEFNRGAQAARAKGLSFAYHNHDFELARVGNEVPLDILLRDTDPALVDFEMDVYWVVEGGGDPMDYMRRYPDRFPLLHIKDSAGPPDHRQTDVGAGTIDFAALLRLDASQRGVVKHLFIEHDNPPDQLAFARASFAHLSRLEY